MQHVVSLHLQISVILEVRGSSHSSVNNDCSRLDIKETLIQYREVEREKTGLNSLKGVLVYVSGVTHSISQQKTCTVR